MAAEGPGNVDDGDIASGVATAWPKYDPKSFWEADAGPSVDTDGVLLSFRFIFKLGFLEGSILSVSWMQLDLSRSLT